MNELIDGTGYCPGDAAIAILITLSGLLTYARIGFESKSLQLVWPRMLIGVGFTVWAMRFWHALITGIDIIVAPVSMIAIGMVTSGYCVVQMFAIRRAIALCRHPIVCLQDDTMPCLRDDRVRAAMNEDRK